MAITFSIPNTEIVMTSGQTNVSVQDIINAARLFESTFSMMGQDHTLDADGKANLGGGVFTEIVMFLRDPWTLRFADEASAHTSVTGGTTLAFESDGVTPRPVTTNFALTINQSVSGTLVETETSGLTPAESAALTAIKTKTDQLAFTKANEVDSNVQSVNDKEVIGDGTLGNEWGPAP